MSKRMASGSLDTVSFRDPSLVRDASCRVWWSVRVGLFKGSFTAAAVLVALLVAAPSAGAATATCGGVTAKVRNSKLVRGGAGDDVLIGGPRSQTILGGAGDDRICAGGGNDIVHGG